MLSHLNKIVIFIILIFLFTSCTSKKYYSTASYKKSKSYSKIKNQKMRNSAAVHRATMRSYIVHGKRYHTKKTFIGEEFEGIASWYGPDFHAKLTSNGETYDMFGQTAASKTLPMNVMVKVYNQDNGKSTIVRINDRGPFITGRIIDLSNKAAHDIDMVKKGTANIHLTIIGFNGKVTNNIKENRNKKTQNKFYLQVGVFSKIEGAKEVKRKFNLILTEQYKAIIKQEKLNNQRINRVWISGFSTYDEASNFKTENQIDNAMVIAD